MPNNKEFRAQGNKAAIDAVLEFWDQKISGESISPCRRMVWVTEVTYIALHATQE